MSERSEYLKKLGIETWVSRERPETSPAVFALSLNNNGSPWGCLLLEGDLEDFKNNQKKSLLLDQMVKAIGFDIENFVSDLALDSCQFIIAMGAHASLLASTYPSNRQKIILLPHSLNDLLHDPIKKRDAWLMLRYFT